MKYLRYRNLYDHYMYSGVADHLPEWTVLRNSKLTLNAVYRFMGYKDGKIELSTQRQLQEMDHPLPKKDGNLVEELLKPFDSNGDDVESVFVNPFSVTQWLPSLGDEVFYDGQYHVIVETERHNPCTISKKPNKEGFPAPYMLSKGETNLENLRHYRYDQSHRLYLYPIGDKPLYGEGWGTNRPALRIEDLPFVDFSIHTKLIPVLGRSRTDFQINEGTIVPYRHHFGYRSMINLKCVDDSNSPLVKGNNYALDMIDLNFAKYENIVVLNDYEAIVAKSSRFTYTNGKRTLDTSNPYDIGN